MAQLHLVHITQHTNVCNMWNLTYVFVVHLFQIETEFWAQPTKTETFRERRHGKASPADTTVHPAFLRHGPRLQPAAGDPWTPCWTEVFRCDALCWGTRVPLSPHSVSRCQHLLQGYVRRNVEGECYGPSGSSRGFSWAFRPSGGLLLHWTCDGHSGQRGRPAEDGWSVSVPLRQRGLLCLSGAAAGCYQLLRDPGLCRGLRLQRASVQCSPLCPKKHNGAG